jgi:hypothetical protein
VNFFMSSSVKRSWLVPTLVKKPVEDICRDEQCYENLAHFSSVQDKAGKELFSLNLLKMESFKLLF